MSPTQRGARIPLLLQDRPWQLPELAAHLGIGARQLGYDLDAVRAAGWHVQEEIAPLGRGAGRVKAIWIDPKQPRSPA